MYIESLTVKNLRCFREVEEMAFQYPGHVIRKGEPALRNVNLLLGNNGTGKTTILKGIALALISPVAQNAGLRPYNLVRRVYRLGKGRPPKKAEINAKVLLTSQDFAWQTRSRVISEKLFVQIFRSGDTDYIGAATRRSRRWSSLDDDDSPAFLVVGYGASRRAAPSKENITSRTKEAHLRYQRVRSLFEEDFSLVPLSYWLPSYDNPGRRKQIIQLLDQLLGGEYKFSGDLKNGEYLFEREKARVPLLALSDGPRAFVAWLSDLLFHVRNSVRKGKKLQDVEGVVMVDEIDLHLHPEWQRTIIKTLSETFPNIQFIFTSHSPLVTGSLEWQNIWVMKDNLPKQLPDEPIYGLSADQVLQSKYFNLDSTRPPEVAAKLLKLDAKAQRGDREAGLEFMRRLTLGSAPQVLKA
jgi:energy-coupling factor transporter ATP-binding protein EcfA2